jgi:hypothetical protein
MGPVNPVKNERSVSPVRLVNTVASRTILYRLEVHPMGGRVVFTLLNRLAPEGPVMFSHCGHSKMYSLWETHAGVCCRQTIMSG